MQNCVRMAVGSASCSVDDGILKCRADRRIAALWRCWLFAWCVQRTVLHVVCPALQAVVEHGAVRYTVFPYRVADHFRIHFGNIGWRGSLVFVSGIGGWFCFLSHNSRAIGAKGCHKSALLGKTICSKSARKREKNSKKVLKGLNHLLYNVHI